MPLMVRFLLMYLLVVSELIGVMTEDDPFTEVRIACELVLLIFIILIWLLRWDGLSPLALPSGERLALI